MYVCVCVYVCTSMYVCMHVCVCMYVCMYMSSIHVRSRAPVPTAQEDGWAPQLFCVFLFFDKRI